MDKTSRRLQVRPLMALWGSLLLAVGGARALDPVFTNDTGGATQEVRVCVLTMRANEWENSEPWALPVLAGTCIPTVAAMEGLRPANWHMVNPLAPPAVTQDIYNMWNGSYNGPVSYDGQTATVQNDYLSNGNNTLALANANQLEYTAAPGHNTGGPSTYLAHCSPLNLLHYGVGGDLVALPAVGKPLTPNHPAYWEVPLTARTVGQLANFDVVLLNTQRNLKFTEEEGQLLQQFLDQGGTLYFENSHGCRLEVLNGSKTDPGNTNFFFHFQFVDNFPTFGTGAPARPDGYPLNEPIFTSIASAWTAQNQFHPLLTAVQSISAGEIGDLGDVQWHDQLLLRGSPGNYLAETVLKCNYSAYYSQYPLGAPPPPKSYEPAVAVARVGSGKLIMSGIDVMEDVHKSYTAAPDVKYVPDMKWMLNVIGWRASLGGNRRGGPSNQGVAAATGTHSLVPRFVWNAPAAGISTPQTPNTWNVAAGTLGDGSINLLAQNAALNNDGNYGLKEPLCAANGVVYVQYHNPNTSKYYIVAIDSKPDVDRDGDGAADDGIPDYSAGAPFDTLWIRDMGDWPVRGATVVSITHAAKQQACDVLLTTQTDATAGSTGSLVRVRALNATLNKAQNATAPIDTPGGDFYNWTSAAGSLWGGTSDGYTDLNLGSGVSLNQISPPVAYFDTVYVAGSYDASSGGAASDAGGWARVFALRMVPDPSKNLPAGQVRWSYPDPSISTGTENVPAAYGLTAGGSGNQLTYLLGDTLKQVDLQCYPSYISVAGWTQPLPAPYIDKLASHGPSWARLAIDDTTHLLPVVARVKDNRTGLTTPTVFLNRANGDAWAITADTESLGWHVDGPLDPSVWPTVQLPNWGAPVQATDVSTDVRCTFDKDPANLTVAKGADIVVLRTTAGQSYREQPWFGNAVLTYKHGVRGNVVETRPIVPRHRLLRTNRDSGYDNTGGQNPAELFGYSFGAPMLWDSDTLVTTAAPLYYGSTTQAQALGGAAATAGNLAASGPVTFLDARTDSLQNNDYNQNHFDAVRWVFDPSSVLPTVGTYFGSWGAPVKYNNSVVVAGSILAAGGSKAGALLAVDPNPSFTAPIRTLTLNRGDHYVLLDPEHGTPPLQISPTQYTLDYESRSLSLRPDLAHMTRLVTPLTAGTGKLTAYRQPLYGRYLTLLHDTNGNGIQDGAPLESAETIYVPSPVRWAYLPGAVVLDCRGVPTGISVRSSGGAALGFTQDTTRPQVIRIGGAANQIVTIAYNVGANAYTQRYRVGDTLPGFSFSPVVGGDRLYISGTRLHNLDPADVVPANSTRGVGGLYSFGFGSDDHVVTTDELRPETVPGWSNATVTTVASSQVRGIPLPTDDGLFVSYDIIDTGGNVTAPLYCLGGSQLLVTEGMRLSRLTYDGQVQWQLTGMKVQNNAEQKTQTVQYNPAPSTLQTIPLSRPNRAYNLPGDGVLLVDTGNNRVASTSSTGIVLWPLDLRVVGAALKYFGLRDFGLSRPTDAARFQTTLPDQPDPLVTRDLTVVADRGNRRLVLISSYDKQLAMGPQTRYDALNGQKTDNAGGFGIELTAPQVYNAGTKQWVDLAYVEVQAWNPDTLAGNTPDPKWSTDQPWTADDHDTYIVARVDGSDQLFNVGLFPQNDGRLDANNDGKPDGLRLSMGQMLDRWSNGAIFRGLRAFRRFSVGTQKFLAVVMSGDDGRSKVAIFELSATQIASAANGVVGTNLKWPTGNPVAGPWTFDFTDYQATVYDSGGAGTSFYERQGALPQDRLNWWANGQKGWNPLSISRLGSENLLAIVNGAANSVNQTGSNSEVLLVRFDPKNLGNKTVDRVLPDLSSTANYPATAAATRTRPSTGSYPLSSPVYATQ